MNRVLAFARTCCLLFAVMATSAAPGLAARNYKFMATSVANPCMSFTLIYTVLDADRLLSAKEIISFSGTACTPALTKIYAVPIYDVDDSPLTDGDGSAPEVPSGKIVPAWVMGEMDQPIRVTAYASKWTYSQSAVPLPPSVLQGPYNLLLLD